MTIYHAFDAILDGHEVASGDGAVEYARGVVWSEIPARETSIAYGRYVDTVDGVDVYYDYGADYYFFVDGDMDAELS